MFCISVWYASSSIWQEVNFVAPNISPHNAWCEIYITHRAKCIHGMPCMLYIFVSSWYLKCQLCVDNIIHFWLTNRCSCESVEVFREKNVLTWGGSSSSQPSESCRMPYSFELSCLHICCHMFWNTGSGGMDIFVVKSVNISNVNCADNSIHFRFTNGCSC